MRRILNLNRPGVVFAKLIGLFVLGFPALLSLSLLLFKKPELAGLIRSGIKTSLAIGAFLLVVLLVLVAAEQIQDRQIDLQYRQQRGLKRPLAHGYYECQYCGNRKVKGQDRTCRVCGKELT